MIDRISRIAYAQRLEAALQRHFAPWSKMPPEVWAEEVYRLPSGGRFRWSYAPYARAMFLSLFDRATIETIFMLYSRGLKSTAILLAIGYIIDKAPRRILSLWPTNSQAEKFSKDTLTGELLDTTPPLYYLGTQNAKRAGSNTLLHKNFPGGLIDMFGANAPGDMRRAKGSMLYVDEIDAIAETAGDEGDQLAIFDKRGDEYPDTIKVKASYPSLKVVDENGSPLPGHSRIDSKLRQTDHNEWHSTCVACGGEPFVMRTGMVRYEPDRPAEARLECPRCRALLTDAQRYEMVHKQGFENWRPRHEFRGRRGFHGTAMLWPHAVDPVKYPGGFLQLMVEQKIAAEASDNPRRAMRVFVNTVDAEAFDPAGEAEKPPEWRTIYNRREEYTEVPEEALVLTSFIDVQGNRLEVEWKAWAPDEQSWGMSHVIIDGIPKDPDLWQKGLAVELQRTFKHASGAMMGLSMGLIDAGHFGEDIYTNFFQWLAKPQNRIEGVSGKIRASKGEGKHNHPIIDENWRAVSKNLKGHHLGTWEAKDLINHRLRLARTEAGFPAGYMHLNTGYGEVYCQQLCTGEATIEFQGSEEVRKYLNKQRLKDEGLDLAVGNLAAFRLRKHRWNFEAIRQQLKLDAAARAAGAVRPVAKPRVRTVDNPLAGLSPW